MLFEIRVIFDKPLVTKSRGFLRVYHETFDSNRLDLKPIHMFHFLPIETTLEKTIEVFPAAVSSITTNIIFEFCPQGEIHRVPYISDITVQVRDEFGNQRSLLDTDVLLINIDYSNGVKTTQTTTQDENSIDYKTSVTLNEAFLEYNIYATLNGVEISQPRCTFQTIN